MKTLFAVFITIIGSYTITNITMAFLNAKSGTPAAVIIMGAFIMHELEEMQKK